MKSLLRNLIHLLSLRERSLLLAFIFVGLLIWGLEIIDQAAVEGRDIRNNREILTAFESTLELKDSADQLLENAKAGLDRAKTFSAPQLVGRVDSIARSTSLNSFDISSPSTTSTEIFSFHSVRLSVKRASMEELIRFDSEVKTHSPYIALSQFQFTANARDPRQIDATFELVSFELKEDLM